MIGTTEFQTKLYDWYGQNKRELPWNKDKDPYKIWLSEIILQQTRVEQGWAYFERFIAKFPSCKSLAQASEDEVLKMWEGLGYYSRARNLHQSAKIIQQEFNGQFPDNYKDILSLKGVGPYTAGAISSFAFGLPRVAVDGNVLRIISRIFSVLDPVDKGKGQRHIQKITQDLLDQEDPGKFNQALMDFGSLQCKPKKPDCQSCPFSKKCGAYKNEQVDLLPYKANKIKKRSRYFHFLIYEMDETTWVDKRHGKDIWQHLYQFPLIETSKEGMEFRELPKDEQLVMEPEAEYRFTRTAKKHVLSHQNIYASFHHLKLNQVPKKWPFLECDKKALANFAFPKLIDCYLNEKWLI